MVEISDEKIPSINGKTGADGVRVVQQEFLNDVVQIMLFLNKNGMTLDKITQQLHQGIDMGAKLYEDDVSEEWTRRHQSIDIESEIAMKATEEYRRKLKEHLTKIGYYDWLDAQIENEETKDAEYEEEERKLDAEEYDNWNPVSEAFEDEAEN